MKMMNSENEKKRGIALSVFLILMMVSNPITAFSYFTSVDLMLEMIPNASKTIIYFLGWLSVLNTILSFGVWHWNKQSINGLYAIVVVIFIINIYLGFGVLGAAPGLMGALILYLLTRKKIDMFD
ncbi:hypothetical protein [Vibrio ziniensis]|uniref:Uncharacterized protein n=1 Tax=Vibrio ziniensis TaxID=2711221 RepID=A0A6G7CPY0_9VIBR|nr:hypothetical protein [Vibrio ziniensis]QIH44165.1 hypothetical protein G5S32_19595 [Vibrio ziniensis]